MRAWQANGSDLGPNPNPIDLKKYGLWVDGYEPIKREKRR